MPWNIVVAHLQIRWGKDDFYVREDKKKKQKLVLKKKIVWEKILTHRMNRTNSLQHGTFL